MVGEASAVDENDDGAMVATVTTENASEVTVDNDYFEVADGNLKLKDGMSLDFESVEGGMIELTLTASGDGESATAMVTVTVNDVNEAPMIEVADGETPDGMRAASTVDENVAGALLGEITLSDPDSGQTHTLSTSNSRFVTKQDAEGGWWLALADDASLNHEAGATVTVTVTVTDSGDPAMSASTDVTITVNDINEAPTVTGEAGNVTGEAGKDIKADPIDLLALFSDPDEGDAPVRYELSGAPDWLTFSVEFGEDDDGNDTAHGMVTGKAPTTGPDSDAAHKVTLTATDGGGAEASVSFYVIIDDGNDAITDVDFVDNDGNVAVEAEVDENDASGVVFGEIKVHDQDHAMHPSGTHLIQILKGADHDDSPNASVDSRFEVKYDDAGIPWLALKAGMSLDQEMENGSVDVTIRAVDLNGAKHASGPNKGDFMGNVDYQTVTILINDKNDAPKANTIGNWWVTVEENLRSGDVTKGSWLDFGLETGTGDADKPAFTDADGDKLTYSLSGPSFLEINKTSGVIENKAGGVPVRGVHRVTVTATDPDGESASATFHLAVAFSGPEDNFEEDNEPPEIRVTSEVDYDEGSGERRVATFTVTDDDNDLGHHPFALDGNTVRITAVVNSDDDADTNNTTDQAGTATVNEAQGTTGYGGAFRLSDPVKSGDTWTYHVYVRDTNPSARTDTTDVLDYEEVDRLTITITASDGVADAVTDEIEIRIDDVNEKPEADAIGDNPATRDNVENDFNIASGTYGVQQSEAQKEVLYIKLEDLWTDPEGDDDPDDLEYSLTKSGSWITILHQPGEWGEIKEGRDGRDGTADDVAWNSTTNQTAVVVGDDSAEPGDRELVAIIEIDRTGSNNGQGDEGSFTITARDTDGATGSMTYKITPTDENLPPVRAVTLTGSPREDATLRATFNDDKDPDLAGSATPAAVLYQWFRVDGDTETLVRQSTGNTYRLTQADVGDSIRVKVKYYEVFQGQLVGLDTSADLDPDTDGTQINGATTSRTVSNTPDKGAGHVTILADSNALTITARDVRVTDGDYADATASPPNPLGVVPDTSLSYSWEWSDNGRGGWTEVPASAGAVSADGLTLTLDSDGAGTSAAAAGNGQSKYYRVKVTYDADNIDTPDVDAADEEMESVYSDPIQVSNIRDATATAPTITGNAFPGGTLSVNVPNTSVQWQMSRGTGDWMDIPGATGSLTITQAHAGANIRAVVSYNSTSSASPGVTAVVAVNANGGTAIPGGTTASATPVAVGKHDIEASVTGTGHGPTASNNAGHNLSLTHTVPLASLFQDPDGPRISFTAAAGTDSGLGANSGSGTTYVFDQAAGGVLIFEASTGKLTFNSDVYRTHDGTPADGAGNVITLNITASDGTNTSTTTAAVNLRINVAPTDIWFAAAADTADDAAEATTVVTVNEHVGAAAAPTAGMVIAHVNVQDQNSDTHKSGFGTHDVTVSGDDRFMITNTGNGKTDGNGADGSPDGSTWEVRLKGGQKLDFETQKDMDPVTAGKQIVLTLTATDGGGLSTPPGAANAIKLTITVSDVEAGDRNQPTAPTPNDVPGLTDDETTDPDNEREDDTTDDDADGGSHPPPPGTSIGGIIEDFVDNMDTFEQDLLEDFMLIIDDGIDIA
ncbi:MAG: putative Ig domain-containing protein [Gammaproteobacteria bacterium]|nr:putative Ig domain-containing protein [Gammaproteobacteria bacterium]